MAITLVERVRARVADPDLATTASRIASSVPRVGSKVASPLPAPVSAKEIAAAEKSLGFRLPPLLSQFYMTIANGGFGPGHGIVGMSGGFLERNDIAIHDGNGLDLVGLYYGFRGHGEIATLGHSFDQVPILCVDPEGPGWYDKLLVISNHGSWTLSCVDCSKKDPPVLSYIGYELELRFNYSNMAEWIEAWLEGGREY